MTSTGVFTLFLVCRISTSHPWRNERLQRDLVRGDRMHMPPKHPMN